MKRSNENRIEKLEAVMAAPLLICWPLSKGTPPEPEADETLLIIETGIRRDHPGENHA